MSTNPQLDTEPAEISRDRVIEINHEAWDYWRWHARQPTTWTTEYLRHRGLPQVAAGLAPEGWTRLVGALTKRGYNDAELLAAGLARRATNGFPIDTFRDRLVLPIRDRDNAIIGFTARRNPVLDEAPDPQAPKYLNTRATPAFDKSSVLYGLDRQAHASLTSGEGAVVIVEGALDAEAIRTLAGPWVPVAACGTAITPAHVKALASTHLRALRTAVIALDPDPAGRAAAQRLWDHLSPGAAAEVRAARLHDDPAQMVQDGRADDLARQLTEAPRYVETLVDDHLANLAPTFLEQHNALLKLAGVVGRLDPYTLGELAERLAAGYRADPGANLNLPSAVAAFVDAHERQPQVFARRAATSRGAARAARSSPPARVNPHHRQPGPAAER